MPLPADPSVRAASVAVGYTTLHGNAYSFSFFSLNIFSQTATLCSRLPQLSTECPPIACHSIPLHGVTTFCTLNTRHGTSSALSPLFIIVDQSGGLLIWLHRGPWNFRTNSVLLSLELLSVMVNTLSKLSMKALEFLQHSPLDGLPLREYIQKSVFIVLVDVFHYLP